MPDPFFPSFGAANESFRWALKPFKTAPMGVEKGVGPETEPKSLSKPRPSLFFVCRNELTVPKRPPEGEMVSHNGRAERHSG